jgi:hypothetical protein
MKLCPFCAEEIQDQAIKCRFCNEFLDAESKPVPWYLTGGSIIFALLCLGPFALPMVWIHPKYSTATKVTVSVIVLAFTIGAWLLLQHLYEQLAQQLKELGIRF